MLQEPPPYFLHGTQNKRICETASGFLCWKARVLVVNGETTKALLVWPHHPSQHHFKKAPCKAHWRAREDRQRKTVWIKCRNGPKITNQDSEYSVEMASHDQSGQGMKVNLSYCIENRSLVGVNSRANDGKRPRLCERCFLSGISHLSLIGRKPLKLRARWQP